MAYSKTEREYLRAERKAIAGIARIFEDAFIPANPVRMDISHEFRRPIIKTRIRKQLEPIFSLGTRHADRLIKQRSAAASSRNEDLVEQLTAYTAKSLAFIADDTREDLVITLTEGYAEGESIPALSKRIRSVMELNRPRAVNLARTMTNEVYNQAHYNRYMDSSVVGYIQFSAHIDSRTSPVCRMLNGTIWKKDSPDIQRPPLHFGCRSRILPYFGTPPGPRDYSKWTDGTEVSPETINRLQDQVRVFRTKYWKVARWGKSESLMYRMRPINTIPSKTSSSVPA